MATLCTCTAWAAKADRDQPMHLESDSLRYDDVQQTGVFEGNAVLTQGSLVLRGQRIELRKGDDGMQHGLVQGTASRPAFYRQKQDSPTGENLYVEGQAQRVEYDEKTGDLQLIKTAVLRRYRDGVLSDETTGERITYNNISEVFAVNGAPASAGAKAGRVRIMLTPPPKASAPGNPGSAPGLSLRPALRLASSPGQ